MPIMEKFTDREKYSNLKGFEDLVIATMDSYVIHPNASPDLQKLFEKATVLAASALAPNTKISIRGLGTGFLTLPGSRVSTLWRPKELKLHCGSSAGLKRLSLPVLLKGI